MATDPDTPGRELRLRAEAISPTLAEHAPRKLQDRIGLSYSDNPDGAGYLNATLTPETVALRNAVLDPAALSHRVDGDTRAAPPAAGTRRCTTHSGTPRTQPNPRRPAKATTEPGSPPPRPPRPGAASTAPPQPGPSAAPTAYRPRGAFLRILRDTDTNTAYLNADMAHLRLTRLRKTVSKAQWRVLLARDSVCVVRGCHRRPAQCQAHHAIHRANSEPTNLANLANLANHQTALARYVAEPPLGCQR